MKHSIRHLLQQVFLCCRNKRRPGGLCLAFLGSLLLGSAPLTDASTTKRDTLVLSGPPAVVSYPLIHMAASGALKDIAEEVRFELWTNPDQLRVSVLRGKTDFTALPTNVAANLANRGAPVHLLNVSTWGILWMVSRDSDRHRLKDFAGETIAVPFRGDMPDVLFSMLAREQGLNPAKDFRIHYVASPMDAAQLLIARRVDHAVLAEPAVAMVLRKTGSFPIGIVAPKLHRAFSFSDEWGETFASEARIPQAGIAAVGEQDDALSRRVAEAYAESLDWCQANPEACGTLVAEHVERLDPEAVADAVRSSPMEAVPIDEAKDDLQKFYKRLHAHDPGLIGGKLPNESFYSFDGSSG